MGEGKPPPQERVHMAVYGKVPVGSNSNSAWIYGGKNIGVAGPIGCPLAPWAPGARWAHRAGRLQPGPAGGLPFFCFTEAGLT